MRFSQEKIRKQLATLNHYMRNVAKGDVTKLCEHTRELMFELNAAGETTNDLLANLIEALKEAPDSNFQRWLSIFTVSVPPSPSQRKKKLFSIPSIIHISSVFELTHHSVYPFGYVLCPGF